MDPSSGAFDDFSSALTTSEAQTAIAAAITIFAVIMFIFVVVPQIIEKVCLTIMAKRRKIKNYGLIWVPVASSYVNGALADQYNAAIGTKSNWRKIAPIVRIAVLVIMAFVGATAFQEFVQLVSSDGSYNDEITALAFSGSFYLIEALGLAFAVIDYICIYKIFASANPSNATAFLLLTIFLAPIARVICFCLSCKKDGGFIGYQEEITPTMESYSAEEDKYSEFRL